MTSSSASASRPLITSSTATPGPNTTATPSRPAVPNSTVLTPFATATAAQPTAAALLTVVAQSGDIRITDFTFTPATTTVSLGTAVTWSNAGPSNHTVTADDGSFDSGVIQVNAKFSFTPSRSGTFAYHCTIHPTMHGTLVVS